MLTDHPLPRFVRAANVVASHRLATLIGSPLAARAQVQPAPFAWDTVAGPWYDNNFAVLEVQPARMRVSWWSGEVEHGDHDAPRLACVAQVELNLGGTQSARTWRRRRKSARAGTRRVLPVRGLPGSAGAAFREQ